MKNGEYSWESEYVSAVLETDKDQMLNRVNEAENAIQKRLAENPPPDAYETAAITRVRAALSVLSGGRAELD